MPASSNAAGLYHPPPSLRLPSSWFSLTHQSSCSYREDRSHHQTQGHEVKAESYLSSPPLSPSPLCLLFLTLCPPLPLVPTPLTLVALKMKSRKTKTDAPTYRLAEFSTSDPPMARQAKSLTELGLSFLSPSPLPLGSVFPLSAVVPLHAVAVVVGCAGTHVRRKFIVSLKQIIRTYTDTQPAYQSSTLLPRSLPSPHQARSTSCL